MHSKGSDATVLDSIVLLKRCFLSFQGKDVIGTAHTGSGKTAAFALPILQKLAIEPFGVFALVLTPTRCASYLFSIPSPSQLQRAACFPSRVDYGVLPLNIFRAANVW